MQTEEMLEMLDTEIARLTKARDLLVEVQAAPGLPGTKTGKKRGRKPGTKNSAAKKAEPVVKVKRGMSPEGKARIAAAQKKRWAKQRKVEAAAKAPDKKTVANKTAKKAAKKTAVTKSVAKKVAPVATPVETAAPAV